VIARPKYIIDPGLHHVRICVGMPDLMPPKVNRSIAAVERVPAVRELMKKSSAAVRIQTGDVGPGWSK
jgi:hypothetical protein